ncbi:MAG: hypothetical protein Q9218_000640 [Villophora microphyllina]
MAPEGQSRPNEMPLELDRDAFIQEAVIYAQKTYALEQELASLQVGHASQRQPNARPDTSHAIVRRRVIGHPAVAHKSQSVNPGNVLLPFRQQAVRQMEGFGLERRQMPQFLEAVKNQLGQVIDDLVSGAPEGVRSEQFVAPAIPASQNGTLQSAVTRRGHFAALRSAKPANATQATPKSIPRASITPQISPDHSHLGNSRHARTSGSALAEGPKAEFSQSSTVKQLSGPTDNTVKLNPGPTKIDMIDMKRQGRNRRLNPEDSHSKGTAGEPLNHSALSHAQFELQIHKIIPVDVDGGDVQLSDADFDRIAGILFQANRVEWSFRPRTYALLKMINAVDLMDDFVRADCLDIAFPYKRGHLPKSLLPEQLDHFLRKQSCVMTKTVSIEGGLKAKHANFEDDADNHLEVLNKLGSGGTGEVDRIRSKLSRRIYARKRLKREETFEQNVEALKLFKREVGHLKKLKHRHLVRYIGSYTDPHYVGIIIDPVADMDLKTFLSQSVFKPAEYMCIREAFGCLCSAIIYLHRQQVRHKDIKPQNILVRQRKVYITDFGLAISWKTLGKGTTTGEHGPISREYAAPEVMDNDSRNISADVWSLGCVYLEMITVLKGETIVAKSAYFLSNGTCSIFYCRNQEAMKGWMKKLESKKDNAPLDWIRLLTMEKPTGRLTPQHLMDRIQSRGNYYGLCCDGKKDDDVAVELRDSDVEVSSGSEDTTEDKTLVKTGPDLAVVEKHLCKAAEAQDVKMLKRWLRKIHHLRKRGLNTKAIHCAASLGDEEITKILIDFGCNLEFKVKGQAPLSSAVGASREETTELLANTKTAINAQASPHLQSALHLAASKSFHAGMETLLRAGALVDIRDHTQTTPLHWAVSNGDLRGVKLLLEHGANPSLFHSRGLNALQLAASRPYFKITEILLDHGAKVDAYDVSTSVGRWPPITKAVSYNRPTAVRLLLQHGANINIQTTVDGQISPSPLHIAAQKRLLEVAEILLQHKPDLELRDNRNQTPLIVACRLLDTRFVQRLLAAGADVKTADESLDTLITEMLRHRHFSILQLLLDHGVSLEERQPLLLEAAAQGRTETIEFLLKNNMPVDAKDQLFLPLIVAAEKGRKASVRVLVDSGASIDARDHNGNTALHAAVYSNSAEIVSLLLEHGAEPMLITARGSDAFGIAKRYGRNEIYDTMLKYLELIGRVVYDRRWPGMPLLLTLDAIRQGYVIDDFGSPYIRILPNRDQTTRT